ncbi:MAG: hypothetical protein K2P84_11215, partial [Undibacterium sp.]|nr:hypothetical protein [Undibacterium sp.]
MLIHITPSFYTCEQSGANVELVDLRVDELGIHVRGGEDLVSRSPYPNKRYVVGCRKVGQKAINGILIETAEHVDIYTVVTRWAINAETIVT